MTCEEVKPLLTDYLDKTLDTATTTRLGTHLISCVSCGALARDLSECISEVRALPALDPPLGFTQRVMAHVRENEPKSPIWQRLFSPWMTKLPLSATAVLMIGVLGVFLYQRDNALQYRDRSETAAPALVVPTDKIKKPELDASVASVGQKENPASKPQLKAAQVHQAKQGVAEKAALRDQDAAPKSEIHTGVEENRTVRRAPIQVQEASNPSESGRFTGGVGFAPPMPSLESLRPSLPRSAPLALERAVPLGERTADYEFVVRRRPPPRRALDASFDFSQPVDEALAARSTPPASATPRIESIAEIRFYNVAPEHFEFFKKELASEAIVESESKTAAQEKESGRFDRHLLVKVTILPATSPESAPPR